MELETLRSAVSAPELRSAVAAIKTLIHPSSPGFSLEQEWLPDAADPRHPLLLAQLRAFAADPCREVQAITRRAGALERQEPDDTRRTSRTRLAAEVRTAVTSARLPLPRVCARITRSIAPDLLALARAIASAAPDDWDTALVGYHRYVESLAARSESGTEDGEAARLATSVLQLYEADVSVQCGRYFGVAGTRVGMSLFYTDLLAKLWVYTDYGLSAPVADVPGFLSIPRIDLPPEVRDDNAMTRLWFGPRAGGVSRAGPSRAPVLFFDHRFTRIYAAGSNPARPGVESRPPENSRRALAWWDRHFDEVADREQEYHRLNQITKWALVTAALADAPAASWLHAVDVRRDLEFLTWHPANRSRLRFSELRPMAPSAIAGKQCLPLISSYLFSSAGKPFHISGGVSTVTRDAAMRVPAIDPAARLGQRMPRVDDLGADPASAAGHAAPALTGEGVPGSGDERRVGRLHAKVTPGRVELEWMGRAAEPDPGLRAATDVEAADRLAGAGKIADAARAYEHLGLPSVATANDLARAIIVDAGRHRPAAVLLKLRLLAGRDAQLTPDLRRAVPRAVAEVGSAAAAEHIAIASMAGKPPADAGASLAVERGRVIVTRNLERLLPTQPARQIPTDLAEADVYVDGRLRIGREGLVPDTGGNSARWTARPDVTVDVIDREAIGSLPDRLHVRATRTTLYLIEAKPDTSSSAAPRPVVVIGCACKRRPSG